jgi:putative FmdB family regulatory protein
LPLYEYHCPKCGRNTEKIETYNGPHLKKCPHCGGKVESVITAPAIQFKGTGWYVTDYGRKTSGGDSSKSEKADKAEKADGKTAPAKESKKAASSSKDK